MNTDDLIVEARARITWGEEPEFVRSFLTANGLSATEAAVKIRELLHERNAEIRGLGIRDILIGIALLGVAGLLLHLMLAGIRLTMAAWQVWSLLLAGFFFAALYGFWRLITGIIRLVRPKSESGSISTPSE